MESGDSKVRTVLENRSNRENQSSDWQIPVQSRLLPITPRQPSIIPSCERIIGGTRCRSQSRMKEYVDIVSSFFFRPYTQYLYLCRWISCVSTISWTLCPPTPDNATIGSVGSLRPLCHRGDVRWKLWSCRNIRVCRITGAWPDLTQYNFYC